MVLKSFYVGEIEVILKFYFVFQILNLENQEENKLERQESYLFDLSCIAGVYFDF